MLWKGREMHTAPGTLATRFTTKTGDTIVESGNFLVTGAAHLGTLAKASISEAKPVTEQIAAEAAKAYISRTRFE